MRMTAYGREAQLRGLADALTGGRVDFYGDERPDEAGVYVSHPLLAELPIIAPLLIVDGALRFSARAEGLALGQARWFVARAGDGRPVLDGTIGRTEGDLVLPLDTIQAGSPITVTAVLTVPEVVA